MKTKYKKLSKKAFFALSEGDYIVFSHDGDYYGLLNTTFEIDNLIIDQASFISRYCDGDITLKHGQIFVIGKRLYSVTIGFDDTFLLINKETFDVIAKTSSDRVVELMTLIDSNLKSYIIRVDDYADFIDKFRIIV